MKIYLLCAALTTLTYGLVFTLLSNIGAKVETILAVATPLTILMLVINLMILDKYKDKKQSYDKNKHT